MINSFKIDLTKRRHNQIPKQFRGLYNPLQSAVNSGNLKKKFFKSGLK